MIRSGLLIFLFSASLLPAQISFIPSLTVEQTQVPAFPNWEPSAVAQTVEHPEQLANFRLRMDYRIPKGARLALQLGQARTLELSGKADAWRKLDLQYEHLAGKTGSITASVDGEPLVETKLSGGGETPVGVGDISLSGDFTAMVRFTAKGDGALFSKCSPEKWEPGARMLGLRGGKMFYDIGWLGALSGSRGGLNDGKPHTAVLRVKDGTATLFVDGKADGKKDGFTRPDKPEHKVHIAKGAKDFEGDLKDGSVENLRIWERALDDGEAKLLSSGKADAVNTPAVNWVPSAGVATFPKGIAGVPVKVALTATGGAEVRGSWVQPLGDTDHADIISKWGGATLAEGGRIYNQLCITCHGNALQEGSMPTSRHFHKDAFKNGSDPFRQYQTLVQGYGLMMPMPQYTAEQKYAMVHYIRETFLAPHNPSQFTKLDGTWLASLPMGMKTLPKQEVREDDSKQYLKMNYGPALTWTYRVKADHIAYKGIAMRLDAGDGGVSRGRSWMVFDHDTMGVAAVTTGSFMDWKGVAFDGSHGTHPSLTGGKLITLPPGPGWANPENGTWEDTRFRGRDGKPYGPLPRQWAQFRGQYFHGSQTVLSYTIGDATVLEASEGVEYGPVPVILRTLNVGKSSRDMKLRLASESDGLTVTVFGAELKTVNENGVTVLVIPAAETPVNMVIALTKGADAGSVAALTKGGRFPMNLQTLTEGGPPRWPEVVTTKGIQGADDGPFATDILTHPESAQNPWQSWIRLTGFDFFADGDRAAVCTWMGDVWIVEGAAQKPLGDLKWRRIATGMFQPLGLRIVKETIYVTCRDQIARLRDLNADGETDFIECFNNDAQVTEHFHEFAMGLQTDEAGNFYYAKSACHAKPALVAHHGTLLRVSADGSRTDILATGFRAANGVCLNPDGTFFVTDQEGHWTPKNRINLVQGKGPQEFYGNMMGYHEITDESDTGMKQPLCWITNAFDRSPSELLWVPKEAKWGPLNGKLLNLSYGYGKIYTVPHESGMGLPQGGMCALPMPQFPTGVMRGRFHPRDGQFYGCGMFAWAGQQSQPGGFYRVRYTGKPAVQPTGLNFEKGLIRIEFSDAPAAAECRLKTWNIKRSGNYGSNHDNEQQLTVERTELNGRTLIIHCAGLAPTRCLEITCQLKLPGGEQAERVIHATVHQLP